MMLFAWGGKMQGRRIHSFTRRTQVWAPVAPLPACNNWNPLWSVRVEPVSAVGTGTGTGWCPPGEAVEGRLRACRRSCSQWVNPLQPPGHEGSIQSQALWGLPSPCVGEADQGVACASSLPSATPTPILSQPRNRCRAPSQSFQPQGAAWKHGLDPLCWFPAN